MKGARLPIKLDANSNGEFVPAPHFRTYGPRTRREFLALQARGGA